MYKKCSSKIKIDGQESTEYEVRHGLREGSVLSPILYAVFIDALTQELEECEGIKVGVEKFCSMLYADDIALMADSPEELQQMLDICQKFADKSSFQFSMEKGKSHVIVFGDDNDFPYEWKLGNEKISQTDRYKYLGLHFHRSLGTSKANKYLTNNVQKRHLGMKFRDVDLNENRSINSVFLCENDTININRWVAETTLLDESGGITDLGSELYYLANDNQSRNTSKMRKMIHAYDLIYNKKKHQKEPPNITGPWEVHQNAMCQKLSMKHAELDRAGCKSGRQGIQTALALTVANALTSSISTFGSEVWQQAPSEISSVDCSISTSLVKTNLKNINNMILGTQHDTNSSVVRYELGIISQEIRVEAASLSFLNSIVNLDPQKHLVSKLFNALRKQGKSNCHKGIANGANYLLKLAEANKWNTNLSKAKMKAAAQKLMQSKQLAELKKKAKNKESVSINNLSNWDNLDRTRLAPYLKRKCPGSLKHGRNIKSKIRCGSYDLQTLQRHREKPKNGVCKLCKSGNRETVEHAVLKCPQFSQLTNQFLREMDQNIDDFSSESLKSQLAVILSDDNPHNCDFTIYKYLQQLDWARKACQE